MTIEQIEPAILFDSNIYLVIGTDAVALIDTGTGFQPEPIVSSIKKSIGERAVDYILLTHRHYDHVGGLKFIIDEYPDAKVMAGEDDAKPLREGDSESTMGVKFGGCIIPTDVVGLADGEVIHLGGHDLRVVGAPGHTIGSVCFYDEATHALFTGDAFFVDGVGRTDLPTGSSEQLVASLRRIGSLDIDGLYPGHGPALKKGGVEFLNRAIRVMGGMNS